MDETTAEIEAVILALRLDTGLPLAHARTGPLGAHLDWALAAGLLEAVAPGGTQRVRLTTSGRLLSNEVFGRLL